MFRIYSPIKAQKYIHRTRDYKRLRLTKTNYWASYREKNKDT